MLFFTIMKEIYNLLFAKKMFIESEIQNSLSCQKSIF